MNKFAVLQIAALVLILGSENTIPKVNAGKILTLAFFSSKSHKATYNPLIEALADRNHSITFVSPIKSKPHKNIKEIIGLNFEDMSFSKEQNMFDMKIKGQTFFNPMKISDLIGEICRSYYNMSEVQALRKEKFDLVLVSAAMNECTYGLIHELQAPFIIISPVSVIPGIATVTATPSPSSFVPFLLFGFSDQMNFFERVANLFGQMVFSSLMDFLIVPTAETVYREFLGENVPSVKAISKNVSLILSNSHLTLSYARPLMPDVIEVGGMACSPAKPLPKDLEDFISGAGKDGVVYFSMGSILQASTMPESHRKLLVNAFSKLKQRVIWKWETETMEDLPKNVKLGKWLPQQDILGHPNVKMFITHGGLGSIVEAVYHGVPLVGIPMFGDQNTNMKLSSQQGFAVTLQFNDLTEESILEAINKILNEPQYLHKAKELSSIYRDRAQNPLETAVYWTEYVMRHKGAKHLRSPARDLNWLQYHSFDAVVFVAGILLLAVYMIFATCRFSVRKCCGSRNNVAKAKKLN